jgi:hypothetical protein
VAVPRPPPPDGHLELHGRLEPVHVRSIEEADLDQSHGGGRIATAPGPAGIVSGVTEHTADPSTPAAALVTPAELAALRARIAAVEPEKGRSAILAAAHLTTALHDLNWRTARP